MKNKFIEHAITLIKQGGIIAYPTEAVYGLGCDPFNEPAVQRLLQIKQRPVNKGLILIAANFEQIQPLIGKIDAQRLEEVCKTWPGPFTWLIPASEKVPVWIRGEHASVALRVTAHPIAQQLCEKWGGPLVSTSANLAGHAPLKNFEAVEKYFGQQIDFIVPGEVGGLSQPTPIRDALTGKTVRE